MAKNDPVHVPCPVTDLPRGVDVFEFAPTSPPTPSYLGDYWSEGHQAFEGLKLEVAALRDRLDALEGK